MYYGCLDRVGRNVMGRRDCYLNEFKGCFKTCKEEAKQDKHETREDKSARDIQDDIDRKKEGKEENNNEEANTDDSGTDTEGGEDNESEQGSEENNSESSNDEQT